MHRGLPSVVSIKSVNFVSSESEFGTSVNSACGIRFLRLLCAYVIRRVKFSLKCFLSSKAIKLT